ncbi:MAG: hypothetical protein R3F43_29310 [bacterium]
MDLGRGAPPAGRRGHLSSASPTAASVRRGGTAGWDAEDVDGDGHPGLTLAVDAPLCGGRSTWPARARPGRACGPHDGALARIAVQVEQRVRADGACLKATAADETQALTGWFRLAPVPSPGTTCPTGSGALARPAGGTSTSAAMSTSASTRGARPRPAAAPSPPG